MENNEYQDKLNEINARYEEERKALSLTYMLTYKEKRPLLDERQQIIYGQVYTRAWIVLVLLVLVNMLLVEAGLVWVKTVNGTYTAALNFAIAYFNFEIVRCDVVFYNRKHGWAGGIFIAVNTFSTITCAILVLSEKHAFIEQGKLTGVPILIFEAILYIVIITYAVVKWLRKKKTAMEDESDGE